MMLFMTQLTSREVPRSREVITWAAGFKKVVYVGGWRTYCKDGNRMMPVILFR